MTKKKISQTMRHGKGVIEMTSRTSIKLLRARAENAEKKVEELTKRVAELEAELKLKQV